MRVKLSLARESWPLLSDAKTLSVTGNNAHVADLDPNAIVIAAGPPFALLALTELTVVLPRRAGRSVGRTEDQAAAPTVDARARILALINEREL